MTESKLKVDTIVKKVKTAIEINNEKYPKEEKKGTSLYLDHTLLTEKDLKTLWKTLEELIDESKATYEENGCVWTGTWF